VWIDDNEGEPVFLNPSSNFHLQAGHGVLHYPWPSARWYLDGGSGF